MALVEPSADEVVSSGEGVLPRPLLAEPAELCAVCGRFSPKGPSLNIIDERFEMRSAVDPGRDEPRGSVEAALAFKSSLAAIRFDLALSRAQCTMLIPANSEIRQQPKTMAAMFPLRFHSAISALVVLVADTVAVVVELLELAEVEVVVDCVEVDVVEAAVVIEVEDVVVIEEVVVDVEVADEMVVSDEVVIVDVSELALVLVVDVVVSEVVVVSRATRMTRSMSRTSK